MVIFESRKERNEAIKMVKLYLDYRKTFYSGYQSYYFFRRRISYALGEDDKKKVRSIFNYFLKSYMIEHEVVRKSHLYLYNPDELDYDVLYQTRRSIEFQ